MLFSHKFSYTLLFFRLPYNLTHTINYVTTKLFFSFPHSVHSLSFINPYYYFHFRVSHSLSFLYSLTVSKNPLLYSSPCLFILFRSFLSFFLADIISYSFSSFYLIQSFYFTVLTYPLSPPNRLVSGRTLKKAHS